VEKPLSEGQWLRHDRFGVGVTVQSDEDRTTIKFDEHGAKTFVTRMLVAELTVAPDRPAAKPRKRSAKTAKTSAV
jgi:hypothetical protein